MKRIDLFKNRFQLGGDRVPNTIPYFMAFQFHLGGGRDLDLIINKLSFSIDHINKILVKEKILEKLYTIENNDAIFASKKKIH